MVIRDLCEPQVWAKAKRSPHQIVPATIIGKAYSSSVWQTMDAIESSDHRIEGYIQCPDDKVDVLLACSGRTPEDNTQQPRFFLQRLMRDVVKMKRTDLPAKPEWLPRDIKKEPGAQYAQRAADQAKAAEKPLIWRKNGGASLGIDDMKQPDAAQTQLYMLVMHRNTGGLTMSCPS